mmetsp:Transcript_40780/g.94494  ORF Transcript_40780/g.94494 Transcript_40780/m.94494 type:complete len:402 (-) Transcript_40780:368-1573(-)
MAPAEKAAAMQARVATSDVDDPLTEQWYLATAQDMYALTYRGNTDPAATKAKILATATERHAAPLYRALCEATEQMPDASAVKGMEEVVAAKLKTLEEERANALENEGESELRSVLYQRARLHMHILDKPAALAAFDETYAKTVPIGQKLDVVFCKLRIGLYDLDHVLLKENIAKAKELLDQGGDWERRNRLKVYEAMYLVSVRQFEQAATLLLDSVATFTATEVCSYERFILYVVIAAQLALDRPTMKSKVVDAPEILAVIGNMPHIESFLNSLYNCEYHKFMQALVLVMEDISADRYMARHARQYFLECRLVAYKQFLESYSSVRLDSMAATFGLSADFLDKELSMYIASGRLRCKIDKVAGVIVTKRLNVKNTKYQATIKEGDLLLNRIQKLSRVINV